MPERKQQILAQSETLRLRSTTEEDLDYVISIEQAEENKRFIMPWEWEQHRAALSNTDLAHLIIETVEENRVVGFVLIAGLENVHHCIELRRIVITEKRKDMGKRHSNSSRNWHSGSGRHIACGWMSLNIILLPNICMNLKGFL